MKPNRFMWHTSIPVSKTLAELSQCLVDAGTAPATGELFTGGQPICEACVAKILERMHG